MKKISLKSKTSKRLILCLLLIFVLSVVLAGCMTAPQGAAQADGFGSGSGNSLEYETTTGIFDTIAIPFGWIVKVFYNLIPNYAVALMFFAIVMKVLLFPFGIKQQKNSVKQASLRPKEMAIRKKYAGREDRVTQQKAQQEIMDLYQREGFNPMGGCLPLLIQFPILFALFSVIRNPLRFINGLSIETINKIGTKLMQAGCDLKVGYGDIEIVKTLSANDGAAFKHIQGISDNLASKADLPNLEVFGLDLAPTPEWLVFNPLIIIPILTFVVAFVTMRLTKKMTYQPTQNGDAKTSGLIMDLAMPALSTWFTFLYPAVLGVYFLFQNILGVVQQYVLKKLFPIPEFTAEDYKKAEQELMGKEKAKKKKSNGAPKRHPRSLHHVDDDEEEIVVTKEAPKANNSMIEPAPLKDEGDGKDEE